jgi:hypothetical protein
MCSAIANALALNASGISIPRAGLLLDGLDAFYFDAWNCSSVIVDHFNVMNISILPFKADSPLIVDSNAELSGMISLQRFEPIAWRATEKI